MNQFIQSLVDAISAGAVLGLAALAIGLVFGFFFLLVQRLAFCRLLFFLVLQLFLLERNLRIALAVVGRWG